MSYPDRSRIRAVTFAEMLSSVVGGPIGSKVYVTDIGEYGAEYISNGIEYTHSGEIEIIQAGKGWIVPSLAAANAATYSQTGNIITVTSTGHNIPAGNYNSKDVYLNMGPPSTGATIPPGWFSNFQQTGVDTFTCVSTVSQTGTGTVNTNINNPITPSELSAIIPAYALGLNGVIKYSYLSSNNNSAGSKNTVIKINTGGTTFAPDDIRTTAIISDKNDIKISSRNSYTSHVLNLNGVATVTPFNATLQINISFSMICGSANDFNAIHSASVYINPS